LSRLQIDNPLVNPDQVRRSCFPGDFLRREVDRLLVDIEVRIGRDAENPVLQFNTQ
jgi:hypothetical protein